MVGKTKGRKVGWIASSDLSRNDTEIISRSLRSIKFVMKFHLQLHGSRVCSYSLNSYISVPKVCLRILLNISLIIYM